jgi:hypothetical protein
MILEHPLNTAENVVGLLGKLHKLMVAIEHLEKTGQMKSGGKTWDFVEAAEVVKIVHKEMGKLALVFAPEIVSAHYEQGQSKSGTTNYHWILDLRIVISDAATGAFDVRQWKGESIDYQDKGLGKALTLCLKYFWLQTLLVGTGEPDPDGMVPQEPSAQEFVANIKRQWANVARELGIIPDENMTAESGAVLKGILGETYGQLAQVQETKALRRVMTTGLGKLFSHALT